MPRTSRMVVKGEKTVCHVMSRTCLAKFPFEDVDKDEIIRIIKGFSSA